MRRRLLACVSMLAACGGARGSTAKEARPAPSSAARAPVTYLIVVSVDGLSPSSYSTPDAKGLEVPTLRELASSGASATGLTPVFPSVTYPNHTTMVTGARPGEHGITTNKPPIEDNQSGWRWYAEDIRVPTLWQVAEEAGLDTAMVNWPVTVGAQVDHLIPEYWRAGTGEDQKLLRALATPGLLQDVAKSYPDLWSRYNPKEMSNDVVVDMGRHIIETHKPHLIFLHLWDADTQAHRHGPWSDETRAAIEATDAQLRSLIESAEKAGIWEESALVVVSDHGFHAIEREIRPLVPMAELGLRNDESPRVRLSANGGMAYLYLNDESDEEAARLSSEFFQGRLSADDSPFLRVMDRVAIAEAGGDPEAHLALVARPGFLFSGHQEGQLVQPANRKGHHGFAPEDPAMQASFLIYGPTIAPGSLGAGHMTQVAPTLAELLGLRWSGNASALPVTTRVGSGPIER